MIIYVVGVLYIIFVLKEVAPASPSTVEVAGTENPGYVADDAENSRKSRMHLEVDSSTNEIVKKGFFREFFDLTLVIDVIKLVAKKRDGNLRQFIIIVLLCNIFFLASLGEIDFSYLYTRLKLNWSGVEFTLHLTYATMVALVGTLLMVGVFSKYFGISDPMIGIVSTICSLIAKPIYVSWQELSRFA